MAKATLALTIAGLLSCTSDETQQPVRRYAPPKEKAYRAAPGGPGGIIRGQLVRAGAPTAGVAYLQDPAPGEERRRPGGILYEIGTDGFDRTAYLAVVGDRYLGTNKTDQEHRVLLFKAGKQVSTSLLRKRAAHRILGTATRGELEMKCDRHPEETAAIVVVDHPYATATDETGTFTWERVPVGKTKIVAVFGAGLRVTRDIEVAEGQELTVRLEAPASLDPSTDSQTAAR